MTIRAMQWRGLSVRRRAAAGAAVARWILGAACAVGPPALVLAQNSDEVAPAQQETQPVDAATKKLTAAHGLFQRGLYKLAAQEYDDFLKANADHKEAPTARYALGVCRYRLGDFDAAADTLGEVLRDPDFKQ